MKNTLKLIVAYDGTDGSEAALSDLSHAGLPASVHAVVIAVADVVWLPEAGTGEEPLPPDWLARAIDAARSERLQAVEEMLSRAASAAERLREQFPSWMIEAKACGDSPAWAILKHADEWHPQLIALGSQGRSALGRLFLGSVSQKVLNLSSCSVRIARPRRTERGGLRLVVGVDGSKYADQAVHAIKERDWPRGTKVRVVAAIDAFMSTALVTQDPRIKSWAKDLAPDETWVHRMAHAAAEELREASLEAEAVVRPGDPRSVLVEESEAWEADALFVGAQGLNAVERLVLGSVSSAVASRAPCTAEVVRTTSST